MDNSMTSVLSRDMEICIENCLNCFQTCSETLFHCLQLGGEHVEASHIQLLESCAESCERIDDEMMHECARVCRECAESCQRVSRGPTRMAG